MIENLKKFLDDLGETVLCGDIQSPEYSEAFLMIGLFTAIKQLYEKGATESLFKIMEAADKEI